jgi:hypothetical protein
MNCSASIPRVFILALMIVLSLLVLSCAGYRVQHSETRSDGTRYETTITEMVPPGCKKVSEGMTDIGIAPDGSWRERIGAGNATDTTAEAEMLKAMTAQVVNLGMMLGAAYGGRLPAALPEATLPEDASFLSVPAAGEYSKASPPASAKRPSRSARK